MAKAKTETKEVIKKNTKTSKKKEVKKAKEIEIIDEIIDDVEEIEDESLRVKANPSLPYLPNLRKQIQTDII